MCLLTQSGGKRPLCRMSSLWSVLSSLWNQTQLQMKKKLQWTKPTRHHQQQMMNTRQRRHHCSTCLITIGFVYCISNRAVGLTPQWGMINYGINNMLRHLMQRPSRPVHHPTLMQLLMNMIQDDRLKPIRMQLYESKIQDMSAKNDPVIFL